MPQVHIKRELEKRRADRTWQDLAAEIGCSVSHLSEVVHGKRGPSPKMRKFLGIVRKVIYVRKGESAE